MVHSYGRILCVDNDPKVCELMVTSLEDSGFKVYETNNSDDALEMFREKKPDLVVCDVSMPTATGVELFDVIQNEFPGTPLIVTSYSGVMGDVIDALHKGAWDYIVKPILNGTVLEQAVCRALERNRLITENQKYRHELENKNVQLKKSLQQLEEDHFAGKSVQQKLLPKEHTQVQDYTISYKILPSLYLSGDFVDYFEINNEKIGFYIADVSGHGASSAFVTILLKSLVEQILTNYKKNADDSILHPEKVLKLISNDIFNAHLGKYLTMIYGVLDTKENNLNYCIGGHYPNPVIWDGKKATFLPGNGFALGVKKDANYECYQYHLPNYFMITMFSDGIFEILKGKNTEEDEKRLLSLLRDTTHIDEILEKFYAHSKEEKCYADDVTILLITHKQNM